jgi:YggT family protein
VEAPPHQAELGLSFLPCGPLPARGAREALPLRPAAEGASAGAARLAGAGAGGYTSSYYHRTPHLRLLPTKAHDKAMRALLDVILIVLDLYIYIVIAAAVLSWLVAFNVVNPRNQFVAVIGEFLYRITEPVLRPIRNMLPAMGGIDISPIILFLIIILIQRVIVYYIYPNVF